MKMLQATPVLVVERIEPVLDSWVERPGFEKSQAVPHGDAPGFVTFAEFREEER